MADRYIMMKAVVGDVAVHRNGGKSKIIHITFSHLSDADFYVRFEPNKTHGAHFLKSGILRGADSNRRKTAFDIVKIIKKRKGK